MEIHSIVVEIFQPRMAKISHKAWKSESFDLLVALQENSVGGSFFWSEGTNIELCITKYCKSSQRSVPSMKHGGGSIMLGGWFSIRGPVQGDHGENPDAEMRRWFSPPPQQHNSPSIKLYFNVLESESKSQTSWEPDRAWGENRKELQHRDVMKVHLQNTENKYSIFVFTSEI